MTLSLSDVFAMLTVFFVEQLPVSLLVDPLAPFWSIDECFPLKRNASRIGRILELELQGLLVDLWGHEKEKEVPIRD